MAGRWVSAGAGLLTALAVAATAVPAVAASLCTGQSSAATVHGPILEVPDESSLCVALGPTPDRWVRITLQTPAADRSTLMAAAFGRNADCKVGRDGRGDCAIEGSALHDQLRDPQVIAASVQWR